MSLSLSGVDFERFWIVFPHSLSCTIQKLNATSPQNTLLTDDERQRRGVG